jgi:rhodanese-related sulfurtransferase
VAQYLRSKGFAEVRPLKGGYPAWLAAGYPVEAVGDEH